MTRAAQFTNQTKPLTRWRHVGRVRWRLEWKAADAWLGLYVAPDESWASGTVWVCALPFLPLHVDWSQTIAPEKSRQPQEAE